MAATMLFQTWTLLLLLLTISLTMTNAQEVIAATTMCQDDSIWVSRICSGTNLRSMRDVCVKSIPETGKQHWYNAEMTCPNDTFCMPIHTGHIEHATCESDRLAKTSISHILPDLLSETEQRQQQWGFRVVVASAIGSTLGVAPFTVKVELLKDLEKASVSAVLNGESPLDLYADLAHSTS